MAPSDGNYIDSYGHLLTNSGFIFTYLVLFCYRQIESTEYVDDLFELKSRYGVPMLSQFAELVNREMFWVVTEVCSEHNLVRRSKIIKQFIKIARKYLEPFSVFLSHIYFASVMSFCIGQCKECKNFNSMFAIVSGLGHGSVSRLRASWEKLPTKYQRLFSDLQELMDPSRNMSKYRQLVASEQTQPPIVSHFFVTKLSFINIYFYILQFFYLLFISIIQVCVDFKLLLARV